MYREFHENGYSVFGLYGVDENGNCECGNPHCTALYKHPNISRWSLIPQWSDEQIDLMESADHFKTGYGVLCKGLLVIDVDARNGGNEGYTKLLNDVPEIGGAGLIVETGSGGGSKHLYFTVDGNISLKSKLDEYKGIDFKSSGYTVGPNSMHKSGNKYKAVIGTPSDIDPAPQALLNLLERPAFHRSEFNGTPLDLDDKGVIEILSYINPDCPYDEWVRVGMAIHETTGGAGFNLWDEWSQGGDKYSNVEELQKSWHSFGRSANPVTVGTLIYYASENGYTPPITFEPSPQPENKEGLPVDISNIDLLRPPSLVGELTKWINSQCRYPREYLAVTGALTAMSNIAGLRYTDDKDRVNLNLLSLCVAGSATGKEAILQSVTAIHEAVRLQPAIVGNIKSEQEIVRNLVRHQAAFYLIDEVGYLLQKIQSGKSAYLEGVIACIMAAYSKADGWFLISGDLKQTVAMELTKELAQCNSKIENNEDPNGYYQRRATMIQERALPQIELGLKNPYLSMMGMTTPVSFDGLVTAEQATNGFIGRCLLVREPETNPKRKRGFKRPDKKLPDNLMMALTQISGYTGEEVQRIEYHGEKTLIKTTDEAADMLEDIADWLEDFAEAQKGRTGLEAIVRRSYELCAKVSTLLAVADGVRTPEHVRWAFALMLRDMEAKIRLAQTNMTEGSQDALKNRILDAAGEGESQGVIVQRACRSKKYKKEDVLKLLDQMVEDKELELVETKHPINGKSCKKYTPII